MPLTKVQIISNAISLLGKGIVTSLVNQPQLISAAEQAYDFLLPSIFSKHQFRFATTIAVLSKLNTTPIGGYWQFAYALPADYLKLWRIVPQNYDFEIYQNAQIYANFDNTQTQYTIEYSFLPDTEFLSAPFVEFFATKIAAYLALSSAQNVEYYGALKQDADVLLSQALAADSQNRPQTPLQSMPVIDGRFVSVFVNG